MPLPSRPLHVAAGLPIDQASRAEHVALGQYNLSNENVRLVERGALDKRFGFTAQSMTRIGGASRTSGRRLFAHGKASSVVDANGILDGYIAAGSTSSLRGLAGECRYRTRPIAAPTADAILHDIEYCAGYVAVAYVVGATPTFLLFDATSGKIVREVVGTASTGNPYLTSFSDRYFAAFTLRTTEITLHVLDLQNLSAGWVLVSSGIGSLDTLGARMSVRSLDDRAAIAYPRANTTDRVVVATFNQTGQLTGASILTSSVTPNVVAIHGSSTDTLWVAWEEADFINVVGLDAATLLETAAQASVIDAGALGLTIHRLDICADLTPGNARVWAMNDAAPATVLMQSVTTSAGDVVPDGSGTTVLNMQPMSRAFNERGRFYMACYPGASSGPAAASPGVSYQIGSNDQSLYIIVDWTEDEPTVRPAAHLSPGTALPIVDTVKIVPSTSGRHLVGLQATTAGETGATVALITNESVLGTSLIELDFVAIDRWLPVASGNSTFLSGGILTEYDGAYVTEVPFLASPTIPTQTNGSTGITGTFRAVAVYEDVDASGNWVISGVSTPSAEVTVANKTITWSTKTLTVSARVPKGTTRVAFYRTKTGGEAPYYRLGVAENDPTVSAATFADAFADTALETNALLYGTGNLPGTTVAGSSNSAGQDRRAPPGLSRIVQYAGMIVGACNAVLWYSGQPVAGEGRWFSPVFQVPLEADIEALAAQDGTLFAWTRDAIYALAGEPPSDNGLQGGLGLPRRLAVDVGAAQWPTCVTSLGVFFVSDRGIELLTRAQTVEWIGEGIQDTVASFPVVTAITFEPESSCVIVELAASTSSGEASGSGRTVVYDTRAKGWFSIDRRKNQAGTADTPAQDGAMIWNGSAWRYAWLGTEGRVYVEDHTTWLDANGSFVTSIWEPAEVKLGLQQDQRTYEIELLFERYSAAGLTVELAHDRGAFGVDPNKVWTEAATAGKVQLPFRPKSHDTSLRLRVRDTAPAVLGNGRGFSLIGLTADIAPKQGPTRGTTRLPAADRR